MTNLGSEIESPKTPNKQSSPAIVFLVPNSNPWIKVRPDNFGPSQRPHRFVHTERMRRRHKKIHVVSQQRDTQRNFQYQSVGMGHGFSCFWSRILCAQVARLDPFSKRLTRADVSKNRNISNSDPQHRLLTVFAYN